MGFFAESRNVHPWLATLFIEESIRKRREETLETQAVVTIIKKYTAKFKQCGLDTVVQAFWSIWEDEKSRKYSNRTPSEFLQYLEGNRKDALKRLTDDSEGPDKMRRTILEI